MGVPIDIDTFFVAPTAFAGGVLFRCPACLWSEKLTLDTSSLGKQRLLAQEHISYEHELLTVAEHYTRWKNAGTKQVSDWDGFVNYTMLSLITRKQFDEALALSTIEPKDA